jgi:diguanylate cyclase (GGDEF)-like protein
MLSLKIPPTPKDETTRLRKLAELELLYTPAEARFDAITGLAQSTFGVPIALVSLVAESCQWFKSAQGLTASQTGREVSFCGHAIHGDGALVVPDTRLDPTFADNPLVTGEPFIRFYAGHPLRYQGSAMGTLCVIDRVPRTFSAEDRETLGNLAAWAENELALRVLSDAQHELIRELDEARRESLVDPLTKVWNRKGMDELLPREFAEAVRHGQEVVMMLLDVDHYKAVNDCHGHAFGDLVLKEIAQRARSTLRPSDLIARYGGDEFLMFAANCSWQTGMQLANRIRARVASERITLDTISLSLSVSIGLCSARASAATELSTLFQTADQALYRAKAAGRHRVEYQAAE